MKEEVLSKLSSIVDELDKLKQTIQVRSSIVQAGRLMNELASVDYDLFDEVEDVVEETVLVEDIIQEKANELEVTEPVVVEEKDEVPAKSKKK